MRSILFFQQYMCDTLELIIFDIIQKHSLNNIEKFIKIKLTRSVMDLLFVKNNETIKLSRGVENTFLIRFQRLSFKDKNIL